MSRWFTLILRAENWTALVVEDGAVRGEPVAFVPNAAAEVRAAETKKTLESLNYDGSPILLAVPSNWCLWASLDGSVSQRRVRRRELDFVLEEHLPISAESFVADYLSGGDGGNLGVCCEQEKLATVIEPLEAAGIAVGPICPSAFLIAARMVARHPRIDGVLIRQADAGAIDSGCFDLIELGDSRPSAWWWLADDLRALGERLAQWRAACRQAPTLLVVGGQSERTGPDELLGNVEVIEPDPSDPDEAAALAAAEILQGHVTPWIDLRRGALAAADSLKPYRRPLAALTAAAILLLICILGVTQWRGRRYERLARQAREDQVELYRDLNPGGRLPASVHSRLASEQRRLAGLGGTMSKVAPTDLRPVSALVQLRDILAALPSELRFVILDLSIQPDMIRVEGRTRSHGEAEAVSVALRQAGGYRVEAPRTQSLGEKGVSFVFTAAPPKKAEQIGEARR